MHRTIAVAFIIAIPPVAWAEEPWFVDVTGPAGINAVKTYQAAWADWEDDGDLDLLTGRKLYDNRAATGHRVRLRLRGEGSAIGAQARLGLGERTLTRHVESSTGQGNQSEMTLHFGLGEHAEAVAVEVIWPAGSRQVVTVQPDACLTVEHP